MARGEFPYENAAEPATVSGWHCKHCKMFYYGERAEHSARFCCAKDMPCECGGRIVGSWTYCEACRDRKKAAAWLLKKPVKWNGEFPITIHDDDRYFWNEDDIYEWLADHEEPVDPSSYQWTTCEKVRHSSFEMSEYLADELPEDCNDDFSEIDTIVNDWIAKNVTQGWIGTGERISIESMRHWLPELETPNAT